jgi:ComF family protein
VLHLLFREMCPACSGPSDGGFCVTCSADMPRCTRTCVRCGLPKPVAHCPRLGAPWLVDRVVAPFLYAPPLDHYVRALKYSAARHLGRALGLLVAARAGQLTTEVDVLAPVPLHPARLRERGYNQAFEIALCLARELRVPLLLRGIERRRPGASQTGQRAAERRASVAAAFAVTRSLARLRVGIVDDVVTTGATVNALAAALMAAGAASCTAIAAARTPEARDQPRKV